MSEGLKFDGGKAPLELLPGPALQEVAKVLDFGRTKYSAWNWRGGMAWGRLLGAALRHLFAWQVGLVTGESRDPETGLSHLAHAGCCVLFLIEYELFGLGVDDRVAGRADD